MAARGGMCVALGVLLVACCQGASLPRHTVSGQSAGGSMAMQHLFAFSSKVDGAAVAAGNPYGCGSLKRKTYKCSTNVPKKDDPKLIKYVHDRFEAGLIDNPANLNKIPTVLFSGKNDWMVYTEVMRATRRQLRAFMPGSMITTSFDTKASHVWSLDHGSCKCGSCKYDGGVTKKKDKTCCNVNNCHYDLSGVCMRSWYNQTVLKPRAKAQSSLVWFDQRKYVPNGNPAAHMMKWGMAYVPTGCEAKPLECRTHVHYHGCQYRDYWRRKKWATLLDLNEYGEANKIVIIYPQAAGDRNGGIGCWNWGGWGDDQLFDTQRGLQLSTVASMLQDLHDLLVGGNATLVAIDEPFEEYWRRVGPEMGGGDGNTTRADVFYV